MALCVAVESLKGMAVRPRLETSKSTGVAIETVLFGVIRRHEELEELEDG